MGIAFVRGPALSEGTRYLPGVLLGEFPSEYLESVTGRGELALRRSFLLMPAATFPLQSFLE